MISKEKVKGTRVKTGGESPTPIPNALGKAGAPDMKATRVSKSSEYPRKGEAPATGMNAMMKKHGMKIGTRVTRR